MNSFPEPTVEEADECTVAGPGSGLESSPDFQRWPDVKLERIRIDFDMEQDRLLMVVLVDGGSEVRLWLTRRCVKRFWMAMI